MKKILLAEIKNKILKFGIKKIDYIKILDVNKLIRPYKKNNQLHNYVLIKKKELQKKFNIKIDYLEIRNEKNLTTLTKNKKIKLFVAYYIDKVRLSDNF